MFRRLLVIGLIVGFALQGSADVENRGRGPVVAEAEDRSQCLEPQGSAATARALLSGTFKLGPLPAAPLPKDPTWREDPFHDPNWRFRYHSLEWTLPLLWQWERAHDRVARDRFFFLLHDWIKDDPLRPHPSVDAWGDHSTALRAMVLVCAYKASPVAWLRDSLVQHARLLASASFYVVHGNHALNQDLALLAIGCSMRSEGGSKVWVMTAYRRIETLGLESIDKQGATNEQSVFYEYYNWTRYREAFTRIRRCGLPRLTELERRWALMPHFLAQATAPYGYWAVLGDTFRVHAAQIDPETTFAATDGRSGTMPGLPYAVYRAGFAFGRSGWGQSRPFEDEAFYTLRFGPGAALHAHAEGTAVTLYAFGANLVLDSGPMTYRPGPIRRYAKSPQAHNRVTVEGVPFDERAPTVLVTAAHSPQGDAYVLETDAWNGVRAIRRLFFSRRGYLVVQDELISSTTRTFHQLWHLRPDADPVVRGLTADTQRARANVAFVFAGPVAVATSHALVGYRYQHPSYGPMLDVTSRGTHRRMTAVIVPEAFHDRIALSGLTDFDDGFSALVSIDGVVERVTVGA